MIQKTILGSVLALLASTTACVTPVSGEIEVPIPGGGTLSMRFHGADPNRGVDVGGSNEAQGACVRLSFVDENGDFLGSETIEVPSSVSLPSGTAEIQVEEAKCESESLADGGSGSRGGRARFLGRDWEFYGVPADPDIGAGALLYSMTIRSPDIGSARATRDQLLALGFSAPLPPGVEIHHYSTTRLIGAMVVFTMADDDPFESLTFALNGNPAYATLDDTTLERINGWRVASLPVPHGEFNFDPSPGATWSNEFEVRYTVAGTSREFLVAGDFAYTQ